MKQSSTIAALLLMLMSSAAISGDKVESAPSYDIHYQNRLTAQLLMDLFFQTIDRGELNIFDKIVSRDMITPTQLAYVYQLNGDEAIISIFCHVNSRISVPDHPHLYIDGISIHLDQQGNILNVKSHVKTAVKPEAESDQ